MAFPGLHSSGRSEDSGLWLFWMQRPSQTSQSSEATRAPSSAKGLGELVGETCREGPGTPQTTQGTRVPNPGVTDTPMTHDSVCPSPVSQLRIEWLHQLTATEVAAPACVCSARGRVGDQAHITASGTRRSRAASCEEEEEEEDMNQHCGKWPCMGGMAGVLGSHLAMPRAYCWL